MGMSNSAGTPHPDLDNLTARNLLRALTVKHVIGLVSLLGVLIAGSFAAGQKWSDYLQASEVQPLQAQLQASANRMEALDNELHFLRSKEKFLELTATLQFQAMLRGKPLDALYPSGVNRLVVDETEFGGLLERYKEIVDEITQPSDGRDPVADLRTPRVPPPLLVFRKDSTSWVPMRAIIDRD